MIAFSIWPINIYRYGIFYFIGFVTSYFFLIFLWKSNLFNKYPNLKRLLHKNTDDILITAVIWVIVWWRLWHVLIYDLTYFAKHPLEIFAIRKGGMSFIWGMIGTTIAFLVLKKIKQLSNKEFFLLMDSIIIVVPLGIILWRIWNFLNQELYGIIVQANKWWRTNKTIELCKTTQLCHVYPKIWPELRINTNFLSSFFEGLVPLIILSILQWKRSKTKKLNAGLFAIIFVISYSFARFWLDYIRQSSQTEFIWQFSKSQRFFIVFFWLWLIFLIRNYLINKKIN